MHKQNTFRVGFTIIEVVIVIVIISILATLTYVGIGAWRERVAETEVRSDISNVIAGMEDWRNFNNGYPEFPEGSEFDGSNPTSGIFRSSEGVKLTYVGGDATSYCIEAQSVARPGVFLFFMSDSKHPSPLVGTCAGGEGATPRDPNETIFVFDTTAPGCTGTVQLPVSQPVSGGTVDWGDGQRQSRSASLMQHTYSTPGTYTVSYIGPIEQASYYAAVNGTNAKCLTRVQQWSNSVSPTRVNFYTATNLTYVAEPPRSVADMSYMFYGANIFNHDISGWDVSSVSNMRSMFLSATSFNQPIGEWDVSNVTEMRDMFSGAYAFNQPIGEWDVSNVGNMMGMFSSARAFNQPIGSWNVSGVRNMSQMFRSASTFNQPIGTWDVSRVQDMRGMFEDVASSPLRNTFNQPIGEWNTKNVRDMSAMFHNNSAFNQDISDWRVTGVMFWNKFRDGASALATEHTPPKFR